MSQKRIKKKTTTEMSCPRQKLYQQNNIISKTEERYLRAINLQRNIGEHLSIQNLIAFIKFPCNSVKSECCTSQYIFHIICFLFKFISLPPKIFWSINKSVFFREITLPVLLAMWNLMLFSNNAFKWSRSLSAVRGIDRTVHIINQLKTGVISIF